MQRIIRSCVEMLPLLALLQAPLCSALALKPIPSLDSRGDYSEKEFDFLEVERQTGLNPYYFLAKPALSLPRVSVCLPRESGEPHVDGCHTVFDNIPHLKDKNGNFAVKPGECRAINAQCCQVTVCAPRLVHLLIPATEVHLQVTEAAANCTDQHLGAVYMDSGWDYLVMVHKPKDLDCWPDGAGARQRRGWAQQLGLPVDSRGWPTLRHSGVEESEFGLVV